MGKALEAGRRETLLDYHSPHGAEVTHLRGLLLMNAIDNLRGWGVYEAYLERLPTTDRAWLNSTLATSWVPIEQAMVHYRTVEQLDIAESDVVDAGGRMASRVVQMFLSGHQRAAHKNDGVEVFASVLEHNDKLWERMYQGGRTLAYRLGRRDFLLEDYGNPLASFDVWRTAYLAFMRELADQFAPGAQVHEAPDSSGASITVRFSWL